LWLTKTEEGFPFSPCQYFCKTFVFTEMKKAKRSYVLRARAERLADTRARIVEAIMFLHQEVGPRHTTISAIAKHAGVERLTVYRHFSDETEMFSACSHRYLKLNPPPQPAEWATEVDPFRRTHRGLEEIYAFFSRTAPMFEKIYRDVSEYVSLKEIMDGFDLYLRDLADDLATGWPGDAERARRAVILRHATKFSTWQSLTAERVGNAQKVALILGWLTSDTSK
jgi:AcrR family transcriptional regulator